MTFLQRRVQPFFWSRRLFPPVGISAAVHCHAGFGGAAYLGGGGDDSFSIQVVVLSAFPVETAGIYFRPSDPRERAGGFKDRAKSYSVSDP